MSAPESGGSMLVYARAEGCDTPALLMKPEADWPVALFTRIALSSLRADRKIPRTAVNHRTGEVVPTDQPLSEVGLLPYDMIVFRLS